MFRTMSKVKEGRIKYSAMCNDDGCVIDDGVVVKLGGKRLLFHYFHRGVPVRLLSGSDTIPGTTAGILPW